MLANSISLCDSKLFSVFADFLPFSLMPVTFSDRLAQRQDEAN
jgi:hypothetical protein